MIHRAKHESNFLRVDNATVRDGSLSLEARGLLIYLLTMNDNWEFSVKGIARQTGRTERAVMKIVKELKTAGYIIQEKVKDDRGHFNSYVWHIYETPELSNHRTSENRQFGSELSKNRTSETPNFGKSAPIRTINNKELSNIKNKQLIKEKYKRKPLGINNNVFMEDEEREKLNQELGAFDAGRYIDLLSFYLKDHPEVNYKSHYETVKRWYERDKRKTRPDVTPLTDPGVNWMEIQNKKEPPEV